MVRYYFLSAQAFYAGTQCKTGLSCAFTTCEHAEGRLTAGTYLYDKQHWEVSITYEVHRGNYRMLFEPARTHMASGADTEHGTEMLP
jgi:uncharacterized protein YwlG (UPF0340 family)